MVSYHVGILTYYSLYGGSYELEISLELEAFGFQRESWIILNPTHVILGFGWGPLILGAAGKLFSHCRQARMDPLGSSNTQNLKLFDVLKRPGCSQI